jgi:glycosyltransferase involved in cell wall biosynthesis
VSSRPLSILLVGPVPPHQGGSAIFWAQVLPALARRGHSIEVIAPITEAALRVGDSFAECHPELTVRRYPLAYFGVGSNIPPPAEYREHEGEMIDELLAEALSRGRPDVVIAAREVVLPHMDRVSHLRRLLVIHGTTIFGIDQGTFPPELAEPLLAAMRRVDLLVTMGRHSQRRMRELGVPGVQVIPNPVDVDRFRPLDRSDRLLRELAVDDDDLVVLHASKLSEQKRPMDILGAAEIALQENRRLLFVVAGDGRCREDVERECRSRGLYRRFRFPGWIDHERMPELMSVGDMFIMPSAYECQALVYLEALACGRPLIASDIPAAREVVRHGSNGLLHQEGDENALAAAILACADDPELRGRLAANGLTEARLHALPLIVDAYEDALDELVQRPQA